MFQSRVSWYQYSRNNKKQVLNQKDVTTGELLSKGNCNDTFKGILKDKTTIAVKTRKDDLSQEWKLKFLQEAKILKQYNHPNIVKLMSSYTNAVYLHY